MVYRGPVARSIEAILMRLIATFYGEWVSVFTLLTDISCTNDEPRGAPVYFTHSTTFNTVQALVFMWHTLNATWKSSGYPVHGGHNAAQEKFNAAHIGDLSWECDRAVLMIQGGDPMVINKSRAEGGLQPQSTPRFAASNGP